MAFQFEPAIVLETFPLLVRGLKLTVEITVGGLFFGFFLGSAAGLMKISRNAAVRLLVGAYIESIRGTPMLVQAMFLYYGVPLAIGVRIAPVTAGIIIIAVNSGAYIAEIVRGAVQSINPGQMEAGRSIGLTHSQAMFHVIWPQALKRLIPPLGNQFIITVKDTSILTVIGVAEMTYQAGQYASSNFEFVESYTVLAVFYLVLISQLTVAVNICEQKMGADVK